MIIPTKFLTLPGQTPQYNSWIKFHLEFPITNWRQKYKDQIEANPQQIPNLVLQTWQESQYSLSILMSVLEEEFPQYLDIAKRVLLVI